MSERKITAPANNPESEPFYKAAEQGKFLIRRCTSCKKAHWYPRAVCPFCFGPTEWEEASGKGVIYSHSHMVRAGFTIAYVTLAEGPVMMTNIVDTDPATLKVGQAVKLKFMPTDGGPPVPCFTAA